MTQVILVPRPLPRWLTIRYALLWKAYDNKTFNYEQAKKTLDEKDTLVIVVLSTLRRMGWLEVTKNPEDKRTRMYKLVDPTKAMLQIAKSEDP